MNNQNNVENETGWTLEIKPRESLFHLNLREIWQYRDLLEMYIKREIVTFYEQTILGPLGFFWNESCC